MAQIKSKLKASLKSLRLLETIRKLKYWTKEKAFKLKYGRCKTYEVNIREKKVLFSTEDDFSLKWFYPRYKNSLHEPQATELFVRISEGAENILDVGANIGWFSCIAASVSDGKVHAFEMDEENLWRLKNNVGMNEFENVKIEHAAVIDQPKKISYWKEAGSADAEHRLGKNTKNKEKRIDVTGVTVDQYAKNNCESVDVIKVDVEGVEHKVIKGAKKVINVYHPCILMEVHPEQLSKKNVSVGEIFSMFPDEYEKFKFEDFRGQKRELKMKPIDDSDFDPSRSYMVFLSTPEKLKKYAIK